MYPLMSAESDMSREKREISEWKIDNYQFHFHLKLVSLIRTDCSAISYSSVMGQKVTRTISISSNNDRVDLVHEHRDRYIPSRKLILRNKMIVDIVSVYSGGSPCVSKQDFISTKTDILLQDDARDYHLSNPYANIYVSKDEMTGELSFQSMIVLQ